ncbi:MAG: hypothetical protein MdMp014T_1422 [Treponematales bacterium]
MKRKALSLIAALGLLLGAAFPARGQQEPRKKFTNEAEIYCKTVPIEKIYTYRKGFVVRYWSQKRGLETAYIPLEWFREAPLKAELITFGAGSVWPALMVMYKDGVFQRCRLYARRDQGHESWDAVPFYVNLDDRFDGATELKLQF